MQKQLSDKNLLITSRRVDDEMSKINQILSRSTDNDILNTNNYLDESCAGPSSQGRPRKKSNLKVNLLNSKPVTDSRFWDSGGSTEVDGDGEVVGSNPARCWAFSLLYLLSSASLLRSLMEVQHYWFSLKMLSHGA